MTGKDLWEATRDPKKVWKESMLKRYGNEETYREHMRSIGSKGGTVKGKPKGFAHPNSDPVSAGRKSKKKEP